MHFFLFFRCTPIKLAARSQTDDGCGGRRMWREEEVVVVVEPYLN